jgi:uncharacterized protein YjiK
MFVSLPLQAQAQAPILSFESNAALYDRDAGLMEPSGLAIRPDGGFWTVSDDTDSILEIERTGEVSRIGPSQVLFDDLEGIVYDRQSGWLLVVSESGREILLVDPETLTVRGRFPLSAMRGADGLNLRGDGPEGIAIRKDGTVVVVLERQRLLLEISSDLSEILRLIRLDAEIGFSAPGVKDRHLDVSGITFDDHRNALWILSDTGQAVYFLEDGKDWATRYDLVFTEDGKTDRVSNAEGIAVSADGKTLSIVTDDGSSSRLLRYLIR